MSSATGRPSQNRVRKFDPSPRKGDRRREEILDGAEQLLTDVSLLDLTFDRIAKNTGVSRSSIYFYFDSKWAVVDALIERASHEMLARSLEIPADLSLEDYLDAMNEASLDGWRTHRAVFLAAAERSSHADESTDRWRAIMAEFVDLMAARIEQEAHGDRGLSLDPVGGANQIAEIFCWTTERNLYMLFSRPHTVQEEDELSGILRVIQGRVLGLHA